MRRCSKRAFGLPNRRAAARHGPSGSSTHGGADIACATEPTHRLEFPSQSLRPTRRAATRPRATPSASGCNASSPLSAPHPTPSRPQATTAAFSAAPRAVAPFPSAANAGRERCARSTKNSRDASEGSPAASRGPRVPPTPRGPDPCTRQSRRHDWQQQRREEED